MAPQPTTASCRCGACTFQILSKPSSRFICHCNVCQSFNESPFADVALIKATQIALPHKAPLQFKRYRPPPNIRRGKCLSCGSPVVELGGFGPLTLAFIPIATLKDDAVVPAPACHIFYEHRVRDAHDTLPKHEGYWRSEVAVMTQIARSFR